MRKSQSWTQGMIRGKWLRIVGASLLGVMILLGAIGPTASAALPGRAVELSVVPQVLPNTGGTVLVNAYPHWVPLTCTFTVKPSAGIQWTVISTGQTSNSGAFTVMWSAAAGGMLLYLPANPSRTHPVIYDVKVSCTGNGYQGSSATKNVVVRS